MSFFNFNHKRRHGRKSYGAAISFVHKGQLYHGTIKDLSLGGAFIITSWVNNFSPGDSLMISIPFTNSKKNIKRKGFVKWVNDEGFGVEFM